MLNHSCQRCRSKKLRCDGQQPCANCARKGLTNSCIRPLRKERPRQSTRRSKSQHLSASSIGDQSPISSSGNGSDSQLAPIVKTVAATSLRHSQEEAGGSPSLPSSASTIARSKVSSIRKTLADVPYSVEGATPTSEGGRSNHASGSSQSRQPRSLVENFTRPPPSMSIYRLTQVQVMEARQLLGTVPATIRILKYIWIYRCQSTSHSAVHVPTLKRIVRQVFDDEWAHEVTHDQLCLLLMSIAISIQFAPRKGPYAHVWNLVEGLGDIYTPEERQRKLHQMTRHLFQGRLQADSCTLEGVQTAMLLLLYDLDEDSFKEYLFEWSIRGAKLLKLDHIGYPTNGVPTVEAEMGTRVWWFLVCRDGLAGLSTGTFAIDPSQFTTRVPTLITDDDLAHGRPSPKPVAECSTVALSLPLINLASVVRRLVDIRSRGDMEGQEYPDLVADAFDRYVDELPTIFSLGASVIRVPSTGDDSSVYIRQRLETERWLLHQQIFHAYLQLYEIRLDLKVCDQIVALASHILHLQDKVRDRCAIVDGLRINVTGVMRAITVLAIDLLQKHKDSKVSVVRQLTLGKIHEAIRKCEESSKLAEGDLDNAKRLMEWEEMAWREKTKSIVPSNSFCLGSILSAPVPGGFNDNASTASSSSPALSFSSIVYPRTGPDSRTPSHAASTPLASNGALDISGTYHHSMQRGQTPLSSGSYRLYHPSSASVMSVGSGGSPSPMNDLGEGDAVNSTGNTTPAEESFDKFKMAVGNRQQAGGGGSQSLPGYVAGRGHASRGQGTHSHSAGSGTYLQQRERFSSNPFSVGQQPALQPSYAMPGSTSQVQPPRGQTQQQQHPSMSVHSMNADYRLHPEAPARSSTYHRDENHHEHPQSHLQPRSSLPLQPQGSSVLPLDQPPPPQPSAVPLNAGCILDDGKRSDVAHNLHLNLNLYPSDQALSPLFAMGGTSHIAFQPTWEDICATIMEGNGHLAAGGVVGGVGGPSGR